MMAVSQPSRQGTLGKILMTAALLLITVVFGAPLIWIFAAAFDASPARALPWPQDPSLENFRYLFEKRETGHAIRNSLIVSIPSMIFATTLAALAGYGLSRLRYRHKTAVMYGILLLGTMPLAVTMVAIYDIAANVGLIDTFAGLIIACTAIALPFLTWLMKGFYDAIPTYLDEAALMDGRSRLRAWWDILLPLARPGLAITAGLAFAAAWAEVLLVTILITRFDLATLPFSFFYAASDRNQAQSTAALGVLFIVPILVVFLLLKRYMGRGLIDSTRGL